jgi:protocatechuate 3,4-dioxygenase beta subunit
VREACEDRDGTARVGHERGPRSQNPGAAPDAAKGSRYAGKMDPNRRTIVLQLVSLAALTACAVPSDPAKPGGGGDDTARGDTGGDTGRDTAVDTAVDTGGDTAKDTSDTGGDTAEPVDVCAEATPMPETCGRTSGDGEGPYFRLDAPERGVLNWRGVEGTRLVLAGRLLDTACAPVVGAKIYLWQAGPDGRYDYNGADPNLYGYVTTGEDGTFCFDTLRPPPYTDGMGGFLPAHLHVNIILADAKVLTTQLYFAGDPNLESWQDVARHLSPEPMQSGGERAVFDFVLPATA